MVRQGQQLSRFGVLGQGQGQQVHGGEGAATRTGQGQGGGRIQGSKEGLLRLKTINYFK